MARKDQIKKNLKRRGPLGEPRLTGPRPLRQANFKGKPKLKGTRYL